MPTPCQQLPFPSFWWGRAHGAASAHAAVPHCVLPVARTWGISRLPVAVACPLWGGARAHLCTQSQCSCGFSLFRCFSSVLTTAGPGATDQPAPPTGKRGSQVLGTCRGFPVGGAGTRPFGPQFCVLSTRPRRFPQGDERKVTVLWTSPFAEGRSTVVHQVCKVQVAGGCHGRSGKKPEGWGAQHWTLRTAVVGSSWSPEMPMLLGLGL